MLPLKDVRSCLASLQRLGIIETQEVPKGNHNAKVRAAMGASGEFHFWSLDLARAYQVLLESVYKTLANILQRKAAEMDKYTAVRAREERVGGRSMRGGLGAKDQEELRDFDDMVRKMTLAEARCELVVFILRDLPGLPGLPVS
jgi:DNA-directed RNA polymerase III subunit RPC3